MALSECCVRISPQGQELIAHGSDAFPLAIYEDDFQTMQVPWHWHAEWEAVYIAQGSCTVAAGSSRQILHAGQGFFINAGVLHGCWDLEHTGCRFHSLVFHPRLIGAGEETAFHSKYVRPLAANGALEWLPLSPSLPWQKTALEAIEEAWQSCRLEVPGYELTARSALSTLTLLLWQHMPAEDLHPEAKVHRAPQRIKAMMSFIHENYSRELTLSQIASTASISESECLRCFRTAIGTTPVQYLKQYRLRQAAAKLRTSQDSISDIAVTCGFQDMSYFSRAFRRQEGCSPSQYRAENHRSE